MINPISIISLAMVDAINPCALAVMTIVLITILTQNPKNRRNVLLGGFAFTSAVFICYFLYGLIIIQFFKTLIPSTGVFANYAFRGFGLFAIILGLLNLRDYLNYKPGGFGTEMPISLRPKMKRLVAKIASPRGAFIIGLFVTFFLLPCTIGPYIIASGKLSILNFLQTVPWLLLYNIIFVIPMILITIIIYIGLTTVGRVSGWKERNIRYLHLVEAIILILLGIAMFTGLI